MRFQSGPLLLAVALFACFAEVSSFLHPVSVTHGRFAVSMFQRSRSKTNWCLSAKDSSNNQREDDGATQDSGVLLKGAWVAAEALGNVAATFTGKAPEKRDDGEVESLTGEKLSREQLMRRLTSEYENEYFISGEMDLGIYEEDCLFADPFASFRGKQRFKQNLANLGLFVSDSECRLLSLEADDSDPKSIQSRVMVKLQLKLPWKPVLAWPWGVRYEVNEATGLISEHIESWEIDAGQGVAQVFRPGPATGIAKSKPPSS